MSKKSNCIFLIFLRPKRDGGINYLCTYTSNLYCKKNKLALKRRSFLKNLPVQFANKENKIKKRRIYGQIWLPG